MGPEAETSSRRPGAGSSPPERVGMDVRRPGRGKAHGSFGRQESGTNCPRGKTQEPRWMSRDRPPEATVSEFGDRSLDQKYRGGRPENGMWGVRGGNVTMTRGQEQCCEGRKSHERCPHANVRARPRRTVFRAWNAAREEIRRRMTWGHGACQRAMDQPRSGQCSGNRGQGAPGQAMRKTARAEKRRSGIVAGTAPCDSATRSRTLKGNRTSREAPEAAWIGGASTVRHHGHQLRPAVAAVVRAIVAEVTWRGPDAEVYVVSSSIDAMRNRRPNGSWRN
jgi:hypothetical protein